MKVQESPPICCTPLFSAPLSADAAVDIAALFRVLGEPARLQLLSFIASRSSGEACVCELTGLLDLSQPTVSHHLKVMYEVGLLSKERRANWIYYKVVPERIEALRKILSISPQHLDKQKNNHECSFSLQSQQPQQSDAVAVRAILSRSEDENCPNSNLSSDSSFDKKVVE